jgi:transposase
VKLATDRDKGCKASEAELAQALTGTSREEHLCALQLAWEAWPFTLGQGEQGDGQIAPPWGRRKGERAGPPWPPQTRPKRRVHTPGEAGRTALSDVVGLAVTESAGISAVTALPVISVLGPGVSRWATGQQFCSGLGLCLPGKKTGGRVRSSRTRRGVNRAALAWRVAARSLHPSRGALGGFLRRTWRAAGGSGGRDGDGAPAGADGLAGVQAREDVGASESAGGRGPEEGEADQGVAAQGPPVGAGGGRKDVGE